jgi:hypothetical protein
MLHPIFSTVLGHPDLVAEHLANYAALLRQESAEAGRGLVARIVAGVLAAASAMLALGTDRRGRAARRAAWQLSLGAGGRAGRGRGDRGLLRLVRDATQPGLRFRRPSRATGRRPAGPAQLPEPTMAALTERTPSPRSSAWPFRAARWCGNLNGGEAANRDRPATGYEPDDDLEYAHHDARQRQQRTNAASRAVAATSGARWRAAWRSAGGAATRPTRWASSPAPLLEHYARQGAGQAPGRRRGHRRIAGAREAVAPAVGHCRAGSGAQDIRRG